MRKVKQPGNRGEIHLLEKGETANPNGRPRKIVTSVISQLKEEGYRQASRSQVVDAFEMLVCLDEDKIKDLIADKDQPMLIRIAGKALLGTRGWEAIKDLLDRAHGKPAQAIDMTSGGDKMEFVGYEMLKLLGTSASGDKEKQDGRPDEK